MANADRFPDVGRSWYEEGFQRVLATLATTFEGLAARKLLHVDDPLIAANHFVGLLLWIPINRAMYTGDHRSNSGELERFAVAAVRAFLAGYGSTNRSVDRSAVREGRARLVRL
jgi:TetR/AcrR family transcriptional repressor of mexJK operon